MTARIALATLQAVPASPRQDYDHGKVLILGIIYPDGTPTQRIGIVPDVVVTLTISGIQTSAEEVLKPFVALIQ